MGRLGLPMHGLWPSLVSPVPLAVSTSPSWGAVGLGTLQSPEWPGHKPGGLATCCALCQSVWHPSSPRWPQGCGQEGPSEHRACAPPNKLLTQGCGAPEPVQAVGAVLWRLSSLAWGYSGFPGAGLRGGTRTRLSLTTALGQEMKSENRLSQLPGALLASQGWAVPPASWSLTG